MIDVIPIKEVFCNLMLIVLLNVKRFEKKKNPLKRNKSTEQSKERGEKDDNYIV
jgi:hypothetical protein